MNNISKWRHYLQDLESPEIFITWGYYSMVSMALERRVWTGTHENTIRPPLWVVLTGPPATGKSRILTVPRNLLSSVEILVNGVPRKAFSFAADMTTQEAIVDQLDKATKSFTYQGKEIYQAPLLCFSEEFGVLIQNGDIDKVNIFSQLYDARNFRYLTKKSGDNDISNVSLSMLACSNPEFIKECFSTRVVNQGFTSRMVVVHAEKPRFRRLSQGYDQSQLDAYEDIRKHLVRVAGVCGELKFSPEAQEFRRHTHESGQLMERRASDSHHLDYYYSRKLVHWTKLSMAFHFAEPNASMEISLATVQAALDLLNLTELTMADAFKMVGTNPIQPFLERIKQLVASGPQSHKELMFRTVTLGRKDLFNEAMEHLTATGQIVMTADNYFQTPLRKHTPTNSVDVPAVTR